MDYRTPSAAIEGCVPYPDDRARSYQAAGLWRNLALHEWLDRAGEDQPEKPFLVGPQGTRTYAEVIDRSRRIAGHLLGELDLAPLDRVVFQLTNRFSFVECFFGCSRAGVIPVMLLPRHREAEARHVVELTDARAYVTVSAPDDFDYPGLVDAVAGDVDALEHRIVVGDDDPGDGWIGYETLVGTDWAEVHAERLESVDVNPCDPAVLLLSGGTTGMPKGIPRTHNDYAFQWERMAAAANARADWRCLPCIPIGHNASLNCVVGLTVAAGATLVVQERLKPDALLGTIDDFDVTYLFAVPAQLVDFLEQPDVDDYDLSCLETLLSGGQKVRPWSVREFDDRWGTDVMNVFGMAEGPLVCTRPGDDVETQAETVGRPIAPDADEFRIVDERRDEVVPDGVPGELAARGPGVFTGYFRHPGENAENVDDDGWFYTEDVLELGADGNYRVYGRLKDTIIRGGENVYAPGVEDVLIEHPAVENVAVIGMPDERLGERVAAFVELTDGADAPSLEALSDFFASRGVAVFKRPERLAVVESLPRTEVGKISKADLRDRIVETLKAEGSLPADY